MNRFHLVVILCVVASTGCSSWSGGSKNANSGFSWSSPNTWFKKEYQTPDELAAIWSPDVLMVQNRGSFRGFGGRIYFYNAKSQAIPVDGDLIVHGYEATGNAKEREEGSLHATADRTFEFSGEELATHFSPSQLGASYSVWIPWDEANGERKEIMLIPTFKTKDGKVVQGSPAKLYLPGAEKDDFGRTQLPAQQVSYRASSTPTNNVVSHQAGTTSNRMRTTTIDVTQNPSLTKPASSQVAQPSLGAGSTGSVVVGGGIVVGGAAESLPTNPPANGRRSFELNSSTTQEIEHLRSALEKINSDALKKSSPTPGVVSLPNLPSQNWHNGGQVTPASYSR